MLFAAISFESSAWGIGFVNGSFEAPGLADATFSVYSTFGTGPTGWSLGYGHASLNNNGARGYGNAHGGSQYIFLPEPSSADLQGALSQTVNGLTVGVSYRFSIWLAGFNATASASECYVRIGRSSSGNPLLGIFVDAPANSTVIGSATSPWEQHTVTFTATTSTETFEIATIRSATDVVFPAADDVSLAYDFNGFPTVQIAKNCKKITVTKAKYNLAGTAQSKIPIRQVVIRLGARQVIASGTNVWLAKIPLKKGKNRITVQAVDAAGTASQPPARITIVRASK
jgi:hypothetical protein